MRPRPFRSTRARVATATGAAMLALLAGGCGSNSSDSESTAPDGDGEFPITMEHAMGETEIESKPTRIVALDASLADTTLLLEAELIGYTQYRDDPDNPFPEYLGDISAETADSVDVGSLAEPDLEAILDLEPDLIVSAKVRHEALYDQLSKIAPTVFTETTGPTWKENVEFLGEAIGEQEKAEDLLAEYEERAVEVGAAILEENPDLTYGFIRFAGEDTARLYSSESFIGDIMMDMGIPRPDDAPDSDEDIFVPLSAERILDADAEFIMVTAYTPPGGDEAIEDQQREFESNPLWERLDGEIFPVDDETFVISVSVQGAHESITELAEHFGVDPQLP